jgi:hypothetical protein
VRHPFSPIPAKPARISVGAKPRKAKKMLDDLKVTFDHDVETALSDLPSMADDLLLDTAFTASLSANAVDQSQKLVGFMQAARSVHRQSNAAAANAAVLTYLVYLGTRSDKGAEWLKAQIEAANVVIKSHNAAEATLKARVAEYKVKGMAMFPPAQTTQDAAIYAEEAAQLAELANLTDKAWTRRQKIEIAARAGTADWTRCVKLSLELHSSANASVISRYSTVVAWLNKRFPNATENLYAVMVKAIADAGGFDAAYAEQVDRQKNQDEQDDGSDDGTLTAEQVEAIATAKSKILEDGINATVAVSLAPVTAKYAASGYTMLLARVGENGLEVLGETKTSESGIKHAVESMAMANGCKTNPGAEFLWTLFSLGDLVSEGQSTALTRNDLAAGETLKTERKVVMRDKEDGTGYEIVVSARYADASIVVTGCPNSELVRLGPPKAGLLTLTKTSRDNLYAALAGQFERTILDVVAVEDPVRKDGALAKNSPAWDVIYRTGAVGEAIAQHRFYLNDISEADHRPLCVEGFKPNLLQNLKNLDLAAMYEQCKANWDKVKKADKTAKTVALTFAKGAMTLVTKGEPDFSIATTGAYRTVPMVTLRAQEFFAVLAKLAEFSADDLTLEVDHGGLLRFSWAGDLGQFAIHLPTATADGSLSSRRLQQMSGPMITVADEDDTNA